MVKRSIGRTGIKLVIKLGGKVCGTAAPLAAAAAAAAPTAPAAAAADPFLGPLLPPDARPPSIPSAAAASIPAVEPAITAALDAALSPPPLTAAGTESAGKGVGAILDGAGLHPSGAGAADADGALPGKTAGVGGTAVTKGLGVEGIAEGAAKPAAEGGIPEATAAGAASLP